MRPMKRRAYLRAGAKFPVGHKAKICTIPCVALQLSKAQHLPYPMFPLGKKWWADL